MTYIAFVLGLTAGACLGVVVAAMALTTKTKDTE